VKDEIISFWCVLICSGCYRTKAEYTVGLLPMMRFRAMNRLCEKCGEDMCEPIIPSRRTLKDRIGSVEIFEGI
jgi:hypothetical protein